MNFRTVILVSSVLFSGLASANETRSVGFRTQLEGSLAQQLFELGERGGNETTQSNFAGIGLGEIVWETSSIKQEEKSYKCWKKLTQDVSSQIADGIKGNSSSFVHCQVDVYFNKR